MSKLQLLIHVLPLCAAVGVGSATAAQAPGTAESSRGAAPQTTAPSTNPPPSTPQSPSQPGIEKPGSPTKPASASVSGEVPLAPDYVIGPGDVLAVVFWRQPDMSTEVVVRPDGRISIPLLNEVDVKGLTPEQLRVKLTTEAQKYVQDPNVTVVIKEITSRRVYIVGQVARPGPYALTTSMTVLQLLSTAGGLLEYADEKNITIMRTVDGKPVNFTFNYKDILNRKNLKQNIELKPDDTVLVP